MNDLTGRMIHGRYQVLKLIGEGAMSVVYLAQNIDYPDKPCALKMLKRQLTHDPKFGRRFTDEARSLAQLDHPNILQIYDFFREGNDYFIALPYIDGMSLADMIDGEKSIPEARALRIFKAMLSALDHGHLKGIIHRDIKPSNVLIDKSGRPLICDFGIVRRVGERGVTAAGMALGTAEYMSPEQIQAPQALDHRADVYSAGVVLYEMLTGRVPFEGDAHSDFAIRKHHVETIPPNPQNFNPKIHDDLAHIVLKSLRKEPGRRYQGCAEFLMAIEKYEQQRDYGPLPAVEGAGEGSRQYRLYIHPSSGVMAVKQGFSWPALAANIFWMLSRQLYWQAVTWAAAYLGLFLFLSVVGDVGDALALLLLFALFVLWLVPGFRGNTWREHELSRRGFKLQGSVAAQTEDAAIARAARGP